MKIFSCILLVEQMHVQLNSVPNTRLKFCQTLDRKHVKHSVKNLLNTRPLDIIKIE